MTDKTTSDFYDTVLAIGTTNRAELVKSIGTDAANAFAEVIRQHNAGEIKDADLVAITGFLKSGEFAHKAGRDAIKDLLESDLPDGVKILLRRVLVTGAADAIKVTADGTPEELVNARKEIETLQAKVDEKPTDDKGTKEKTGVPEKDVEALAAEHASIIAKLKKGPFGGNSGPIAELEAFQAKLEKAGKGKSTSGDTKPSGKDVDKK